MKIRAVSGLPFVSVILRHQNKTVQFENVLLDTGSGGSIFSAERLSEAGIQPPSDAIVRQIIGVGGTESVLELQIDQIVVGSLLQQGFVIELGSVDYGFGFDAILGFDFLQQTGAVIDFATMEIYAERN